MAEIQRLIALGGPAQIARAKAELAKLKEMNQVYTVQIDSLNKVNAQLQAENMNLNSNLFEERSRSENLSSENNRLSTKVAAGSVLKALNVTTEGVRFRSTGKEVLTNKAKQVQKIRTKFTLAENKVIDRGPVDLYIRVIGPDGAVMSASTETFKANGNDLNFTPEANGGIHQLRHAGGSKLGKRVGIPQRKVHGRDLPRRTGGREIRDRSQVSLKRIITKACRLAGFFLSRSEECPELNTAGMYDRTSGRLPPVVIQRKLHRFSKRTQQGKTPGIVVAVFQAFQ